MIDAEVQRAEVRIVAGRSTRLDASLRVTPRGLLAVAGLVAAVLLSTAVLLGDAVREGEA